MNKIYLVDDQPISNFITKKLLEVEGFQGAIQDFTDPTKAFRSILGDKNALIFLDLNMPEMNGWEFMEAMKNKKIFHRIIILTSSTSEIDKKRAKEYPCVIKYLEKPLNKRKFLEVSSFLKVS
tara:strand:- start:39 stop:407 length:369 start_codon:yes stop_codon:yes gene_type:complete